MPLRNVIHFLFSTILLLGSLSATAQFSINSPYSRFGIGLMNTPFNANFSGIGGASVAKFDGGTLNFSNPAFLSTLNETTFQASVFAKQSILSTSEGQSKFIGGQVGEVAVGFKRNGGKWGFGLGMNSESSVGYKYESSTILNDSVSTLNSFEGSGGISKLQLGLGRTFLFKRDSVSHVSHTLSIGGTLDYRFGSILQIDRVNFQNTTMYNSRIINRKSVSDANFTLGVQYAIPILKREVQGKATRTTWLHLGATYEMQNQVHLTIQDIRQSTRNVGGIEYTVLTAKDSIYTNYSYYLPQRINVGASLDHELKTSGRIGLSASYSTQQWAALNSKNDIIRVSNQSFHNASDLRLGIDYIPNTTGGENSIFGRTTYRLGLVQTNCYVGVNGNQLVKKGISGGIQMPARSSKTSTTFSLAFETGNYSTPGGTVSKENYTYIMLGCNLHPFERWFVQRKYD